MNQNSKIRMIAISLLACWSLSLACGQKVAPIGPGNIYEPGEDERRIWVSSEAASSKLQASGKLYKDKRVEEYANGVLRRLMGEHGSTYVPLKPRVFILDSPLVNAFAFPHGDIYLHTGILGRIRSEAQLAMLLGHEITHATHRHSYQISEQTYDASGAMAYISVLSSAGGADIFNLTNNLGSAITKAAIEGYGRNREKQADEVGLTLMAQAGYLPSEGAMMFKQMEKAAAANRKGGVLLYASHPKMKDRVRSCEQLAPRMHPELLEKARDVGQDRYLDVAITLIHDEVERHLVQGNFTLAEETLNTLEKNRPKEARTFALRGELYRVRAQSGDIDLAKASYKRAIEQNPRESVALRGLGFLLLKGGDKGEARRYLESYLSADPNASDADYFRHTLKSLAGE